VHLVCFWEHLPPKCCTAEESKEKELEEEAGTYEEAREADNEEKH
jgi:hypothetical protein